MNETQTDLLIDDITEENLITPDRSKEKEEKV